jgi:VWFA-related protein
MPICVRLGAPLKLILAAFLLYAPVASAQLASPTPELADNRIYLDVVVTPKDGAPVSGLQQQDFTLLDNKARQTITSFRALGGSEPPVEVIMLLDAVNTPYDRTAYARQQMSKFLRSNGGHLAHPTALAVFTDTSTKIQEGFSTDGNDLSKSLDQYAVGLRDLRRSSGFYGASERFELSVKALHQLAIREAARPGRKVVLWISPGWPLLSGPNVQLSFTEQKHLFTEVVELSTELRQAGITLYSIDTTGAGEAGTFRAFYYQSFLKGVSKPNQVDVGNLSLQVLASQSGGLAVNSSNDVDALMRRCLDDLDAYYEISFVPGPADQPNQYHHLEVQVAKPGLIARTRDGYYSQPLAP